MYMNVCRCLSKDFAFVFVLKTYVFQNIVFHLELNLVVQKNLQIIIQTNKSVYKILTNDTFGFTCFLLSPFSSCLSVPIVSPSFSSLIQLPPTCTQCTRLLLFFSFVGVGLVLPSLDRSSSKISILFFDRCNGSYESMIFVVVSIHKH